MSKVTPEKVTVLMEKEMREQLEQLAQEQNRSLSAQIVFILRKFLSKQAPK